MAVSVSMRRLQSTEKLPDVNQLVSVCVRASPCSATSMKIFIEMAAASSIGPQVIICDPRSPILRPNKPATNAPNSGRKTAARSNVKSISALHQMDVFNRDAAAVAEINHKDREADGRLGGGDGQHNHGEDLAEQIVLINRKSDKVDINRQQHQFDRHQNHD